MDILVTTVELTHKSSGSIACLIALVVPVLLVGHLIAGLELALVDVVLEACPGWFLYVQTNEDIPQDYLYGQLSLF